MERPPIISDKIAPSYKYLLGLEVNEPIPELEDMPENVQINESTQAYCSEMLEKTVLHDREYQGYIDANGLFIPISKGWKSSVLPLRHIKNSLLRRPDFLYFHTHPNHGFDAGSTPSFSDYEHFKRYPGGAYGYGIISTHDISLLLRAREALQLPISSIYDQFTKGSPQLEDEALKMVQIAYKQIHGQNAEFNRGTQESPDMGPSIRTHYPEIFARACAQGGFALYQLEGNIAEMEPSEAIFKRIHGN